MLSLTVLCEMRGEESWIVRGRIKQMLAISDKGACWVWKTPRYALLICGQPLIGLKVGCHMTNQYIFMHHWFCILSGAKESVVKTCTRVPAGQYTVFVSSHCAFSNLRITSPKVPAVHFSIPSYTVPCTAYLNLLYWEWSLTLLAIEQCRVEPRRQDINCVLSM